MLKRSQKNSIWGSGPKLLSSTLVYFAIVLYIDKIKLQIPVISEKIWIIYFLSGILVTIGLVIWIIVTRLIFVLYKWGRLYRNEVNPHNYYEMGSSICSNNRL